MMELHKHKQAEISMTIFTKIFSGRWPWISIPFADIWIWMIISIKDKKNNKNTLNIKWYLHLKASLWIIWILLFFDHFERPRFDWFRIASVFFVLSPFPFSFTFFFLRFLFSSLCFHILLFSISPFSVTYPF